MKLKKMIASSMALAFALAVLPGCSSSDSSDSSDTSIEANSLSAANDSSVADEADNSDDPAAETPAELKTIRVGIMTTQPDQYAVFIGSEEGIFEKYGVQVETNEYVAGINTVDAIVNGLEDTGLLADYAAVNRIGNTAKATNLVLFSELSVGEPKIGGLYVAPEYADDLTSLNGSAGWITSIGTVREYNIWQAQTYVGLDPEKQNYVPIDSPQTALALIQTGGATAAVGYGADAKYYEDMGWTLVAGASDIGIKIGSYLVTTREYLAENEDLLADYLRGLNESIAYINNNLDSSAERVEAEFGISADDFKLNWQSYSFEIGFTEEGAAHLDSINDWAFSHGKFEEAYNIRDFIDTSAAEKAAPDNVTIVK